MEDGEKRGAGGSRRAPSGHALIPLASACLINGQHLPLPPAQEFSCLSPSTGTLEEVAAGEPVPLGAANCWYTFQTMSQHSR